MSYKIVVLDLETTINAPAPHFGAAPAWPDNRSVLIGYQADNHPVRTTTDPTELGIGPDTLVVGHNLAFDLHYLMRETDFPNCALWDTQKFEYLITGRSTISPSLEAVCERRQLDFTKDTEVSERFKVGIGADKIDRELLRKYLIEDVKATKRVFEEQVAALGGSATRTNYFTSLMTGILATTKMCANGLPFDKSGAEVEVKNIQLRHEKLLNSATDKWSQFWPTELGEINLGSPSQITALLWGGDLRYKEDVVTTTSDGTPILYKTGARAGEAKTRKVDRLVEVAPLCGPEIKAEFTNKGWEQNSSAATLNRILNSVVTTKDAAGYARPRLLCGDLIELRELSKTINTYFKPYIEYTIGGRIHPQYNHCITQTGRLSSSKPNMQNISGKSR